MDRRTLLQTVLSSAAAGVLTVDGRGRPARAAEAGNPGRPRLSACVQAVFRDVKPFEARLDNVKEAGLNVFEFWSWRDKDLKALNAKRLELGLVCSIFSADTGGPLVAPNSKEKFVPALKASIEAAKPLECMRLIATVGNELKEIPRDEQHRNIVEAMKAVAPMLEGEGFILCIEPLNVLVNHKGYFLATSDEAFQIVDEVGSPNVTILFDIYHQQITEGNVIRNIVNNIRKIGHFHVADVPGRHEPGTGEIHYLNVFRAIAGTDYAAYLGLEMWPEGDNVAAVKDTKAVFDKALAMDPLQLPAPRRRNPKAAERRG